MNGRIVTRLAAILSAITFSAAAQAHVGHDAHVGLVSGLLHPLTGVDHLTAILAAGLWLGWSQPTRAMKWSGLFVAAMLLGAGIAWTGLTLPVVEPMILVSVLMFGLLAASTRSLGTLSGIGILVFFALFHGNAHGMELPAGSHPVWYMVGFASTTLAVQGAAIMLARQLAGGMAALGLRGAVGAGSLISVATLLTS